MKGFFFENYNLFTISTFLLILVVLVFLNEIVRRSKNSAIFFNCILPIIVVILVAFDIVQSPSSETWFGVVKTYSALLGVLGFMYIRYSKHPRSNFLYVFPFFILAFNIIEAVYKDITVFMDYKELTVDAANIVVLGGSWNIINAIAGIILILTLTGFTTVFVSKNNTRDMIIPDMLWWWIIAYDLWNLSYCYNSISTRSFYAGFTLLLASLLSELFLKKGAWLQHRAQQLALFGMFSLCVDYQSLSAFGIIPTYNTSAWLVLSILSLTSCLMVLIYEIYVIIKYKKNIFKDPMYSHTNEYKKIVLENK